MLGWFMNYKELGLMIQVWTQYSQVVDRGVILSSVERIAMRDELDRDHRLLAVTTNPPSLDLILKS